ncbi:hypothetical protein [Paenibacillus dendritiformis]|uniref:hypothetical protein n=1 Tax=Paenibacillus dendritiformis TaxID=130049 RepID=UPI000DA70996|nr:hypothetical protein [Paenibacillus dendritiformis]PZM61812.1 hypothetical protein DOE73_30695 [Paenibacillus dendritiformis]
MIKKYKAAPKKIIKDDRGIVHFRSTQDPGWPIFVIQGTSESRIRMDLKKLVVVINQFKTPQLVRG